MLVHLEISNIAIIEKLSMDFEKGLNILTGETGAGKSIIIDSINALLGMRTSRDLIRSGEEKASVEGIFRIKGKNRRFAERVGIEPEPDDTVLVARRYPYQVKIYAGLTEGWSAYRRSGIWARY